MRRSTLALSLVGLPASPALAAPADTDPTFGGGIVKICENNGTTCSTVPRSLVLQANGRIVIGGTTDGSEWRITRLNRSGGLDPTFAGVGWLDLHQGWGHPQQADLFKLVVRGDGTLLGAGYELDQSQAYRDLRLIAFNPDGSFNTGFGVQGKKTTSFGDNAQPTAMALQRDDDILVAGTEDVPLGDGSTSKHLFLLRYRPGGAVDTSFASSGVFRLSGTDDEVMGRPQAITLQPDRKILVDYYDGNGHDKVLRLTRDGVLDPTFGTGGIVELDFDGAQFDGQFSHLIVQPDGRIVGVFIDALDQHPNIQSSVFRLLPNGALDTSFNGQGWIDLDGLVDDIAWVPTGQIIAMEQGSSSALTLRVARITAAGQLDTTFYDSQGNAGVASVDFSSCSPDTAEGQQVAVQPDGRIVMAVLCSEMVVARLMGDPLKLRPNAFAFTPQSNVPLSTPVVSNAITISGLTPGAKVPVLVTGGHYRINGSPITSELGYVGNGDTIKIWHRSAATSATTVTTTLQVGGMNSSEAPWVIRGGRVVATFTSTTQ